MVRTDGIHGDEEEREDKAAGEGYSGCGTEGGDIPQDKDA